MQFDLKQFLHNGREPWRQSFTFRVAGLRILCPMPGARASAGVF